MDASTERLRALASQVGEISALPEQERRRRQWRDLNDLRMSKPMVYTRDYAWEMVCPEGGLGAVLKDPFLRSLELDLLGRLFAWSHFQADMVVESEIDVFAEIRNSMPLGFREESLEGDEPPTPFMPRTARRYLRSIFGEDDIETVIPMPRLDFDALAFERKFERAQGIFDGLLQVRKRGMASVYFNPWDDLVMLFGIEEGLMGLHLDPKLMHRAMERYVDVKLELLRQYEEAGFLNHNNGNYLIGSGALGYSGDLPQGEGMGAKASECWGLCIDQIFSSVSPELHEEFATAHEAKWMERFGLTYYGCCERLDHKIHLLRKFPNLRKISISPFSDRERAMEAIGREYVMSFKPNSTLLALEDWDLEESRKELLEVCRLAKKYGCNIEIVMKTMISLSGRPERLSQWCAMATDITSNA